MLNALRAFRRDESGAVATDWVALTTIVVLTGMGLVYAVLSGPESGVPGLVQEFHGELNQAAAEMSFGGGGGGSSDDPATGQVTQTGVEIEDPDFWNDDPARR